MPKLPPHVLIVDDEACVRESLGAALARNYVVHLAATGTEACAMLRKHPITAILLDVFLENEHGLDLVERFRALSPAPILILTGHGSEAVAARAVRARVDDYLKKPVSLLELHAALTRLTPSADPPIDPVERARRMMTEHPDGAHTTESLGRQVGLSSRHFRRRFLEATGKTPRRFLTEARMQQAAELLRTTTLGIEQVAQTVGYLNFAAFDRMFKRAFGLTPTEWRASRDPSSHRKTEG